MVMWKAGSVELWTLLDSYAIGQNVAGTIENSKIVASVTGTDQCPSISKAILFFSENLTNWEVVSECSKTWEYPFEIDEYTGQIAVMPIIIPWTVGQKIVW